MASPYPPHDMKSRELDALAVDVAKILFLVAWVWLFALWVDSGLSPHQMWETLQAKAQSGEPLTAQTRGRR